MHVIQARNVAEALPAGVAYLVNHGQHEQSRAGEVLVAPGPVTTVYTHPWERVLTSPVRDANPFFHLMEGLWVLAGRRDATFLDNFIRDYSQRFAERDGDIHDAYGWRLRHSLGYDQLDEVVHRLRGDPGDRQCVLQIWDADKMNDLRWPSMKTRPCNTHIYLRVQSFKLDITVCCRSNDIIWGAYGANAVQFSMLQEYLAARIGIDVGTYYQVSNNYHAYVAELDRLCGRTGGCPLHELPANLDSSQWIPQHTHQLVEKASSFDEELRQLMLDLDALHAEDFDVVGTGMPATTLDTAVNRFLPEVAWSAAVAMKLHRHGAVAAAGTVASTIADLSWRRACVEWLERRQK